MLEALRCDPTDISRGDHLVLPGRVSGGADRVAEELKVKVLVKLDGAEDGPLDGGRKGVDVLLDPAFRLEAVSH